MGAWRALKPSGVGGSRYDGVGGGFTSEAPLACKKDVSYGRYALWLTLLFLGTLLYFVDINVHTAYYSDRSIPASNHHVKLQNRNQNSKERLLVATDKPRLMKHVVKIETKTAQPYLEATAQAQSKRYKSKTPLSNQQGHEFAIHKIPAAFVVDNAGCRIPAMDPFDPHIKKYISRVSPIDCAAGNLSQLVSSNLTSLFVVVASLPEYNVTDADLFECCYRPFWRVEGNLSSYSYGVDDVTEYGKNCTVFNREANVQDEFVKVECQYDGHEIYYDYFAFTPTKSKTEERQEEALQSVDANSLFPQESDGMSVLVLGIDAVSRLNFHRQMPRTDAFLREMQAVEMLGYNKVDDNTFPNLVPVLTGLTEHELQKTCWPSTKAAFDGCPFIWNNFSDNGYRTAFGEDAPWMGIFSYLKVGFVQQPTDYYMRPYSKTYEDTLGHTKILNAKLCIGPRLNAEVLLEYASKFANSMASRRSFGFFWGASLTHDDVNFPQLGDELHETVLRNLVTSGALERTVLIFMSDHGIRWGAIRETYQGRLEERLPLLSFVFPPWFREYYAEAVANLRRNIRRLTTPFDLHYTLADFMDLSKLTKSAIRNRTKELEGLNPRPRGSSLFLPVSNSRTCADAGVLPHWCTCQQSEALTVASDLVQDMAAFLIGYLNNVLRAHAACARLHLASVHDARRQFPVDHITNHTTEGQLVDFVLIVETLPGNGMFEATIRQRALNHLSIAGSVSRINTYGQQSSCMTDYHMKLYCFCQ